MGVGNPWRV